jgi:hypothetical protein
MDLFNLNAIHPYQSNDDGFPGTDDNVEGHRICSASTGSRRADSVMRHGAHPSRASAYGKGRGDHVLHIHRIIHLWCLFPIVKSP